MMGHGHGDGNIGGSGGRYAAVGWFCTRTAIIARLLHFLSLSSGHQIRPPTLLFKPRP